MQMRPKPPFSKFTIDKNGRGCDKMAAAYFFEIGRSLNNVQKVWKHFRLVMNLEWRQRK